MLPRRCPPKNTSAFSASVAPARLFEDVLSLYICVLGACLVLDARRESRMCFCVLACQEPPHALAHVSFLLLIMFSFPALDNILSCSALWVTT